MKHLVIIGSGNIGQIVHWYASLSKDYMKKWDIKCHIDNVEEYIVEPDDVFVCADVKPSDRIKHTSVIREKGGEFVNIIHPMANIAPSANLGTGIVVGAFSTVSINTTIKDDVIIQDHCNIGHDGVIENGAHLYVGVKLCGRNRVGTNTSIYTGSVVYPDVKVGVGCTVGAGSVVSRKVKDGDTVLGNPAKKLEL
jgi:sugar O-acyltransferase (sialic acid O-acetyltransferase NeuD family)